MKRAVVTIAIAGSAVAAVSADNWPQWRGPTLNGASSEKNLPTRWTPGGQHRVEAGGAEPQRGDAHCLGQPHLPERGAAGRGR